MQLAERRARILVIDDEPGVLRAAQRILSGEHDVACASTPAQATEAARTFDPDLAICDIRMPELDGFQLVTRLRELRPGIDIIMMTGSQSQPDTHLVRSIREHAFYFIAKPFDRQVICTLVDRCLELRRLKESQQLHLRRIERELADARTLQQTMLPQSPANFGPIRIEARCIACSELGGDFYDFEIADDGSVGLVLADVAGHGVSASLLTAGVKAAFRSAHAASYDPLIVINQLAESMSAFSQDRFVTVFCARLDPACASITYVNAGHPPAALIRTGDAQSSLTTLDSTGPWVGSAFQLGSWGVHTVEFAPGSSLLAYTDGVTDVVGTAGRYSRPRLFSLFQRLCRSPRPGLGPITTDLVEFGAGRAPVDDMTLVFASSDAAV